MERKSPYPSHAIYQAIEALFVLLHRLGVGQLFVGLSKLCKSSVRKLSESELAIARSVFKETIDYEQVRFDQRSYLGPKQFKFAYVSLNMVNGWGTLHPVHFIHEMMHIWQYQHMGIRYIPRALHAQHFGDGYAYGGPEALEQMFHAGADIRQLNYEQQAELIADYFCLKQGYKAKYIPSDKRLIPMIEHLIQPIFTPEQWKA
jgi:hypothetical protein